MASKIPGLEKNAMAGEGFYAGEYETSDALAGSARWNGWNVENPRTRPELPVVLDLTYNFGLAFNSRR